MSNLGSSGYVGMSGVSGVAGINIEERIMKIMEKYNNRFTIKTQYDEMTFQPINEITDNTTGEKYTFKPNSITDMGDEIEKFMQKLVTDIRQDKINDIINE